MAMNSIDLVTMLPRTLEAAQLQGKEQSQIQHAAEQPGIQFQQRTEQQARQTVESQESETKDYDREDGKSRGSYVKRQQRKKKEKGSKETPVAPRSDSSFDIMI